MTRPIGMGVLSEELSPNAARIIKRLWNEVEGLRNQLSNVFRNNSVVLSYNDLLDTPAIPSGANPSATIGLTATNGSSSSFMRADAAPALSQAITPTWTGAHIHSAAVTFNSAMYWQISANAAAIDDTTPTYTMILENPSGGGTTHGLTVTRSASSTNTGSLFRCVDNTTTEFSVSQAGAAVANLSMSAPTLYAKGDGGGLSSQTGFTNATDTPTTDPGWTSSSTVDMNAPDGYLKAYVGTQAVTIPYWNT